MNIEAGHASSITTLDETPISVSDAHTATEYYLFADFPEVFEELSSESLAHLYSMKVQDKPLKAIRKLTKKKLIEALKKAVCKLPVFLSSLELTHFIRGRAKELQTMFTSSVTLIQNAFLVRNRLTQTVARLGFLVTQGSKKFGPIWRRPFFHLGVLQLHHVLEIKAKGKFLQMDGAFFAQCTSSLH